MIRKIKTYLRKFNNTRIIFTGLFISILFLILIIRVFYVQIIKGEEYSKNHTKRLERNIIINGARGKIYDRNGKILAYNKRSDDISIDISLITGFKNNEEYNSKLNKILIKLISILKNNKQDIIHKIPIMLTANNNYEYSTIDQNIKLSFLRDIFGKKSIDELTPKEKNISANDVIMMVAYSDDFPENEFKLPNFMAPKGLTKENLLDLIDIRTQIYQNRFQKYKNLVISKNANQQTIIDINENKADLQSVYIKNNIERVYNDSKYISNIIGYTSQGKDSNNLDSTIGIMGLEKNMNDILKSKNGLEKLYVDSTGKVIEKIKHVQPISGDDIHLSIDINLQKYIYDTIEDNLTDYYLNHMNNSYSFVDDVRKLGGKYYLPISQIYHAILNNGAIDLSHLSSKLASNNEKKIRDALSDGKNEVLEHISSLFTSNIPLHDLDKSDYILVKYIFNVLQEENIINVDYISSTDQTVKDWLNKKINISTYIHYLISHGCINYDLLSIDQKYSSYDDIFKTINNYLINNLPKRNDFINITSKKLILEGKIKGIDILKTLYDQNFLKKDEYYNKIDEIDTYEYVRNLIKNKKLTPGDIGLDPFSAACVVNDPNTGKVLAMVSYPSYDSNKMNDQKYLNHILNDKMTPLINRPTELLKAPGSTFKPITAAAGLSDKVITSSTIVVCNGEFEKVTPHPHCWVYPHGHGAMNTISAIANSCNVYFNEVGYRLGLENSKIYNSNIGIQRIKHYASLFGLDRKCGLEIDEAQPKISDDNAVASAIGQGNHLYNISNLTRYMSSIANGGDVLNLSLINSIHHIKDNTDENIPTKIIGNIGIRKDYMNTIKEGLKNVVLKSYNYVYFRNVDHSIAGKTGTSEEDLSRGNNSLFVGYTPIDKPEIVSGIIIPNIVSNKRHLQISSSIFDYYYKHIKHEDINEN